MKAWAIYIRDPETALRRGDPLLAIAYAPSQVAAVRAVEALPEFAYWSVFAVPNKGPIDRGVPILECEMP